MMKSGKYINILHFQDVLLLYLHSSSFLKLQPCFKYTRWIVPHTDSAVAAVYDTDVFFSPTGHLL